MRVISALKSHRLPFVLIVVVLLFGFQTAAGQDKSNQNQPSRLQLDEANYLLEGFERYVDGLKGKEGVISKGTKRTLEKVAILKKQFPNDKNVHALFNRAKSAARKLKGDRINVTKELLAYRDLEKRKIDLLASANKSAWLKYQLDVLKKRKGTIGAMFPCPDPTGAESENLFGRTILLDGVKYPEDVFLHYGQPHIGLGNAAKGFYFVNVSNRSFAAAYEAIRRYQRNVSDKIPSEWKCVGKITGVGLMNPDGSKDGQTGQAHLGWTVEVEAIYVPGYVFSWVDPKHELGGTYAAENSASEKLAELYSVNEVPAKCSPEKLLDIFVTAIKEKNYELYLQCIHPEERQTHIQRNWLQRKWDFLQKRFQKEIVAVKVGETEDVKVLAGGANAKDKELLTEFLDAEEVAEITDDGRDRSEMVTIWMKLYDETGRIREYRKPISMKRDESVEDFRWFIKSGFPF